MEKPSKLTKAVLAALSLICVILAGIIYINNRDRNSFYLNTPGNEGEHFRAAEGNASANRNIAQTDKIQTDEIQNAENAQNYASQTQASEIQNTDATTNAAEKPAASEIMVHIAGEVNNPGVYSVKPGSRVADVVDLAGGATENANLAAINLADYVADTQKIIVPDNSVDIDITAGSVQNNSGIKTAENEAGALVNINTASAGELKTLPGIGDVIAEGIINYRETVGLFANIEDIKNVPRIGDKTFLAIADLITVY
ncbi:MAG: ComEA family DNA-binding protein [Clostridiales bacterium]|jgi:competence protein ComEA|nr:ComEA family DNA-binding protein [Clostridiales bacterium]